MFDFSWGNILHSNVINFAIMIAIFAVIFHKVRVNEKLEDNRANIEQIVKDSDSLKEEAKKDYDKVAASLANVGEEVEAIINKAHDTAKSFEVKAKADMDKVVASIKANVEKQVQSEENNVHASVLKTVSQSSVEVAQRQIKAALEKDKTLHRKYVEDFINSIDKLDV